jgi:replicative DNA helicase
MGNASTRFKDIFDSNYESIPVYATGLRQLDKAFRGGIPRNKVALFAARTSHGKSATPVRLAHNFAMAGHPVRVLFAEDEIVEFDLRSMAIMARMPLVDVFEAYRRRRMDEVRTRISAACMDKWSKVDTYNIMRPTVDEICQTITAAPSGAVFLIDHLGEVRWDPGVKHEAIGEGFRLMRQTAIKSKVLLIAMTQLNRDWDRRKAAADDPDSVRPVLSDIEASGQLEQAARYCAIMERIFDGENPTGDYVFHVFKPDMRGAVVRWDDSTCTPDNPEPIVLPPIKQPDLL